MPIKGLTDRPRRLPRLGKIHLGIKVEGEKSTYPRATDFFVCPPEVREVFGERPKALNIAFPVDDIGTCASVWYRCYSSYRGLTAKGDGETCTRLVDLDKAVDLKTGALPESKEPKFWPIARKDAKKTDRVTISCIPEHCEEYGRKQCRMILNLQFLLPDVEGVGVWQIDSSSIYSIKNIMDGLDLIKHLGRGRLALIPLKLSLIPKEVDVEGVKKTIHILQVVAPQKIAEFLQLAALPAGQALLLLPEPDTEAPEGLIPEDVQDGQAPDGEESKPIIIENTARVVSGSANLDDDIFGPQAIDERDKNLAWREILQLLKDVGEPIDRVVTWFQKRGITISATAFDSMAPKVTSIELLNTLRDNLKAYQASRKVNTGTNQGKLV